MDEPLAIEAKLRGLRAAERVEVRERVGRIARLRREQARLEGQIAQEMARLAEVAHEQGTTSGNANGPEYARRSMAAEVALATRVHPSSARSLLDQAERLVGDFPATHLALSEGRIGSRHARAIVNAGLSLDAGARASLDDLAPGFAESRTPGQTEKLVRLQAARLAARPLRERHKQARVERSMSLSDLDDGMSEVRAFLPTFHAHALHDRLTQMAARVRKERRTARRALGRVGHHRPADGWESLGDEPGAASAAAAALDALRKGSAAISRAAGRGDSLGASGAARPRGGETAAPNDFAGDPDDLLHRASDTRTFDQLRVDLLADLLLSAEPCGHEIAATGTAEALGAIRAQVQIVVPARMLLDPGAGVATNTRGALIAGDDALAAAAKATGWDRVFATPGTGEVLAVDRYRPSAEQRRFLTARDGSCRLPGCTTPAASCDIDHSHDHALGGATTVDNLACVCERHHVMKHTSGWRIRQTGGGVLEWTSPAGLTYTDEPSTRVLFRDTEPAPEPPFAAASDQARGAGKQRSNDRWSNAGTVDDAKPGGRTSKVQPEGSREAAHAPAAAPPDDVTAARAGTGTHETAVDAGADADGAASAPPTPFARSVARLERAHRDALIAAEREAELTALARSREERLIDRHGERVADDADADADVWAASVAAQEALVEGDGLLDAAMIEASAAEHAMLDRLTRELADVDASHLFSGLIN